MTERVVGFLAKSRLGYLPMFWDGLLASLLAVYLLSAAAVFGINEGSTSLYAVAPTYISYVGWPVVLGIGGFLTMYGCRTMKTHYEAAGLLCMSVCWFYDAVVIFVNRGSTGGLIAGTAIFGLAGGIAFRLLMIQLSTAPQNEQLIRELLAIELDPPLGPPDAP